MEFQLFADSTSDMCDGEIVLQYIITRIPGIKLFHQGTTNSKENLRLSSRLSACQQEVVLMLIEQQLSKAVSIPGMEFIVWCDLDSLGVFQQPVKRFNFLWQLKHSCDKSSKGRCNVRALFGSWKFYLAEDVPSFWGFICHALSRACSSKESPSDTGMVFSHDELFQVVFDFSRLIQHFQQLLPIVSSKNALHLRKQCYIAKKVRNWSNWKSTKQKQQLKI